MNFRTLEEAENVLRAYVPAVAVYTGDDMSLKRMWPLLAAVGNPQNKLRAIHVAGTSGKSSTCYYAAYYLTASGKKTGLTVSPHVDSITERVQIDGKPLGEQQFCHYLSEFLELVSAVDVDPSYFELLTAFELWVFAKEQVDYVVIETGMGGLLDASNVVSRADKVCVITDIGLDHTHVLGNTIAEIAKQKAGIIHAGNVVYMHEQSFDVMAQIELRRAGVGGGELALVEPGVAVAELPLFQQRNWNLAKRVVEDVSKRDTFALEEDFDPAGVTIPGRMDTVTLVDGSQIIMDGAHNGQKMSAFVASVQEKYPDEKFSVLLGLKKGKEYREVIAALQPIINKLIITTFSTSQDMPVVSQDPQVLADYAEQQGIESIVEADGPKAYELLARTPGNTRIVTGSFYLLGQIRALEK